MSLAMKLPGDPATPDVCNALGWEKMTEVLVELSKRFLSSPENITSKFLKAKFWRSTPTADSIDVTTASAWRPDSARKRPAVVISRQDVGAVKTSIGNQTHGAVDLKGTRYVSMNMVGQHTINAVALTELEADSLAAELFANFFAYGLDIRRANGLISFQVLKAGGPSPVVEHADYIAVPVPVAWALETRWAVSTQALTLAALTVAMPQTQS